MVGNMDSEVVFVEGGGKRGTCGWDMGVGGRGRCYKW